MGTSGFCLHVVGRLRGITRKRLAALVADAGGRMVHQPSKRISLVAVGHSSAGPELPSVPSLAHLACLSAGARTVSEGELRRMLGLAPPLPTQNRTFDEIGIAAGAGLHSEVVRSLALFDVLEPEVGRYGYRDLLAAREVARGLGSGLALHAIVRASFALQRNGRSLADTRLGETPWGEIVQSAGGRRGSLDGQFALPLQEAFTTADEFFERGEEAEATGDLAAAERWYGLALRIDRTDPVIAFNLGNVLDADGRPGEAALAYQQAIARDETFSEAWLNLGALREAMERYDEATACYRRAIEARPDDADACQNLAALLTRRGAFGEALPFWERYLSLRPQGEHAAGARRQAALCRLGLAEAQGQATADAQDRGRAR